MRCGRLFHGFRAGMMLLLLAGSACTIEEGDEVPRRTGTEYAVYEHVRGLDEAAVVTLRVAAGLDEWLRQTTNAGREAVCNRFFAWGRVYDEGAGNWSLQGAGRRYDFALSDGLGLGDPGALWHVTERVGNEVRSTVTLRAGADGSLQCVVSAAWWNTYILYDAAWTVHLSVSEETFEVSAAGDAQMRIEGEQGSVWSVDYRLMEPLVWSERAGETFCTAGYAVRAACDGAAERQLEFQAVRSALGRVTITSGGVTEVW